MNEQSTLTPLRLAILGLVATHPQSGYDLKKIFESTPMGSFSSSPGAIYPALKSLETKGWIRGRPENTGSLRPRVVYAVTEDGDAVLAAELKKPVTRVDLVWHFDLVMLRFAFIERIGTAEALRFLAEFRAEAAAYVRHLEELREQIRDQLTPCTRLALEHGIQDYEGNARWAERAVDELSELEND
jgi:DNA-binding PadR family transcriptional regulator